jgi:hypothetical protein
MRVESPIKIDKKQLAYYPFNKKEVLSNETERVLRRIDLERALQLGNLYKGSVIIYFKNSLNETLMVNATVWALTSKFVELKGGITIPISSVVKVLV